jgi:hypothetical protein
MITINGQPAHLYRVGIGCYSDYCEEWWSHEREMTKAEMLCLLLEHVGEIEREWTTWKAARDAKAQELFGCDAGDIGWNWVGGKQAMTTERGTFDDYIRFSDEFCSSRDWRIDLLKRAGFVELTPTATWHTDPVYGYSKPECLRRQIEGDLERVAAQSSADRNA